MRVTIVGCAGSFPGPTSAASSYLVEVDDAEGRTWRVLLDLGNGALGPLQLYCDPIDLDVIGISHLHPDHVADISGLLVYLRYHPARRAGAIEIIGPFGTASRLGEAYGLEPGEDMSAQFTVSVWQPGRPVRVGPLELFPTAVEHPVPAYAVRITGPSEADPAQPVTFAYSGDSDECDGLDEAARNADVLLCEASFLEGRDDDVRGIHLTGRRAGETATRAGARMLVLTHIPAWNDPADALAEARAGYDGPLGLAHPGLVITL